MDKFWLIVQREYLTRVKKKSFIITTLLTPFAFALFFVVIFFILSYEGDKVLHIAVFDESGILENHPIPSSKDGSIHYIKTEGTLAELKKQAEEEKYSGVLKLPILRSINAKDYKITYFSDSDPGLDDVSKIESAVKKVLREYKTDKLDLDREQLKMLDTKITLDPDPLDETEADSSSFSGVVGAMLGMLMGMMMYFVVIFYGMGVMRSVMEEKTSRIVEVIVSSVNPFQLMMGKIIGVGGVGLTQLLIWAVLVPIMYFGAALIFGIDLESMQAAQLEDVQFDKDDIEAQVVMVMNELNNINWWKVLPLFVFYFLGGYLLYAAMFAAVGAAVGDDSGGESQTLTIPIMIPIAIAIYIMVTVIRSPESSLALYSSLFPLFSPIVMPGLLAFDPPWWQIIVSMVLLVLGIIFFTWLAGRIFRIGILLYGKKIGFKELGKWMFKG